MSRQVSVAAAASTFALAALALLSPGSARLADLGDHMGATFDVAAPMISWQVPDVPPALPVIQ